MNFLVHTCGFFSSNLLRAEETKLTRAYEEKLIQRVKSVFSLKDEKSSSLPPRCATPIFLELSSVWDKLSQEAKKSLSKYQGRPYYASESTYDTPGGRFKIHYTTIGDSAVFEPLVDVDPADGVPDYVNRCADILDSVWIKEVDSLNYNPPPSDGSNGGDDKYDVYLLKLSDGILGYAYREEFVPFPSAYSFIVIRNDYSGIPPHEDQYDWVRVVVAHEFFHAIQFGYDATDAPYWMEMSAVWMEDVCYDHINDHLRYLPWFYNYPWLSLKTFSYNWSAPESLYHAYASCVFPIFLSEKFGTDIIRQIWESCAGWPGPSLWDYYIDYVLKYMYGGRSLDEEFRQFTIWNYFTGVRADTTRFFSEGNLFDMVAVSQTHNFYPVDVSSISHPPSNLASNYIRFVTGGTPGGLRIHFDGEDEGNWKVSLIGYQPGFPPLLEEFDLDSINQGTLDIYNWQDYQEIIMIPALVDWDSAVFTYNYTAEFDTILTDVSEGRSDFVSISFSLDQNYPNPFNPATRIQYTVGSRQTKTADGRLVLSEVEGQWTVDGSFAHTTHEKAVDGSQFMVHGPVHTTHEKAVDGSQFMVHGPVHTTHGKAVDGSQFMVHGPIHTTLRIYNVRGQLVRTLVDEEKQPGVYSVVWDGKDSQGNFVSSGLYFYKLKIEKFEETKKMILVK